MTQRRVYIETTLYGGVTVTYEQLLQLHREVSRAASLARLRDPEHVARQQLGYKLARLGPLAPGRRHAIG